MKKVFEKHGILKCVGAMLSLISFILFIVAAFVEATEADMILKVVGLALFVIGGMIAALKSDEHRLVKSMGVLIVATIIMTWLFPYGFFEGADFYENSFKRIGLVDVGFAVYVSLQAVMDKIVFLLALGGFYGVLSKVSGYQKLVGNLANGLKKHPLFSTVVISVITFVLTSLFSQSFAVLIFIPFFVSVLLKMNLDKLSAFAITFGSALVGAIAFTFGSEDLATFNELLGLKINYAIVYRYIIAAVALVLYNFFLVMRVRKVVKETKKNTKNSVVEDDPFVVETTKEKTSSIPAIVVLVLTALIVILGYIAWKDNFGFTWFETLHNKLIELKIGDDFTIISYLIGSNAKALGNFIYIFSASSLLFVASWLISFLYKMSGNEFINSFYQGMKKVFKPILFLIGAYVAFGILRLAPVTTTVVNWLANLVKGFNPYLTSLIAFVSTLFQNDLGFIAYTSGGLIGTTYATNLTLAHTIFTSINGLTHVVMPASAMLVTGLAMMKVDYKDWLKYIWLFVLGMLVILLVLFTVVAYI